MTAIILIENREAIPVRAIPFVTGWKMPPDQVAWSLAHRDEAEKLEGVTAKHLLANGQIGEILPKEWDTIAANIEVLTKTLKAKEAFPGENRSVWQRDSVRLLPAGCFVWRDEFEAAFRRAYSPRRRGLVDVQRGDRGERAGERELNPAPPIQDLATVMEGFPKMALFKASTPSSSDRAHLSEKLTKMMQAAKKFWANADRNDRGTHPDNATVAAWLVQHDFSKTLADKAATIIRPEWAPTGRKPEE